MASWVRAAILITFLNLGFGPAFAFQSPPPVRFEIRLTQLESGKDLIEAALPGGGKAYLHRQPLITNEDIIEARAIRDAGCEEGGSYGLRLVFSKAAAARMAQTTQEPEGELLAILIDGKVVSLAAVDFTIRDAIAIHLNLTGEQAARIAGALNRK